MQVKMDILKWWTMLLDLIWNEIILDELDMNTKPGSVYYLPHKNLMTADFLELNEITN